MLRVGEHGHKDVGISSNLFNLLAEGDVVLQCLFGLGVVDIESENSVSALGQVDGHGETHVSKTNEAHFGEAEDVP